MTQTPSNAALIVAVAAGSAAGGVARFVLVQAVQGRWNGSFPLGTLTVNMLGCLALGVIAQIATDSNSLTPISRALLTAGFCGGFTTFSAFAGETVLAFQEGALMRAAAYISCSLVGGFTALWFGSILGRMISRSLAGSP